MFSGTPKRCAVLIELIHTVYFCTAGKTIRTFPFFSVLSVFYHRHFCFKVKIYFCYSS